PPPSPTLLPHPRSLPSPLPLPLRARFPISLARFGNDGVFLPVFPTRYQPVIPDPDLGSSMASSSYPQLHHRQGHGILDIAGSIRDDGTSHASLRVFNLLLSLTYFRFI